MSTLMQVYTNLDAHCGTLDGGTVSRGFSMSGTAGIDHLWLTVAGSQTGTQTRSHNVSHTHFLAIKPSSHTVYALAWKRLSSDGCASLHKLLTTNIWKLYNPFSRKIAGMIKCSQRDTLA